MVVVMAPEATEADVAAVVERVAAAGGEAFVSRGVTRTIVGLVGDVDALRRAEPAQHARGQRRRADLRRPYKLVSRQHHPERDGLRGRRACRSAATRSR